MLFSGAMEKGTKIALGIGCGVLALGGCVVGGVAAFFLIGASGAEDIGPTDDFVAVAAPSGPYSELATYVNDAAQAITAAAEGQPHDARWDGASPGYDLRATPPPTPELAALGPNPEIYMTVLELEATNGSSRVRSNAIVFPDGRVKWGQVEHDTLSTDPTPGLATAAPVLDRAIRQMLTTLGGPCDLPVVTASDVAALPAGAQSDILGDAAQIPQACSPSIGGLGWQPKVDDITVGLHRNGNWVMLRSSFQVEGGSLHLSPVRARSM